MTQMFSSKISRLSSLLMLSRLPLDLLEEFLFESSLSVRVAIQTDPVRQFW